MKIIILLTLVLTFFIYENNNENDLPIDVNVDQSDEEKSLTKNNLITFDCSQESWNIEEDHDKDFGHGYFAKNGKVYFYNYNIEQPVYVCELLSADHKTFEVLDFIYARDRNHVYYRYSEMKEADPATFEIVLEGGLAKDKDKVYLFGQILPEIDSDSLKDLGWRYMRTKDGIFIRNWDFKAEKIEEADLNTFEVVNFSDYPDYVRSAYNAKDKNYYYKAGVIVDIKD